MEGGAEDGVSSCPQAAQVGQVGQLAAGQAGLGPPVAEHSNGLLGRLGNIRHLFCSVSDTNSFFADPGQNI